MGLQSSGWLSPWMQHRWFSLQSESGNCFHLHLHLRSPFSFSFQEFSWGIPSATNHPIKKKRRNSQNSLWVNPLVCQEDPHSKQNRGAAIMPQCFQWNVIAIVDRVEGVGVWGSGGLVTPTGKTPPATLPQYCCILLREARYCLAGLWPGGGGGPGQDNERDDTEVIS